MESGEEVAHPSIAIFEPKISEDHFSPFLVQHGQLANYPPPKISVPIHDLARCFKFFL